MPFVASCNYLDGFELIKKSYTWWIILFTRECMQQTNLLLIHAHKKKGRDSNEFFSNTQESCVSLH